MFPSGLRSPARVFVRIAAAISSTAPPSSRPTRFLVSRQSISIPIPTRGLMFPAAPCTKRARPPRFLSTTSRAADRKVGRDDGGARPHRHWMAGIAEHGGDRAAVQVVDADHAHGRVDRMVGRLAEHVAPVAQLTPVDADAALTPAAADPRGLQARLGLAGRLDEQAHERLSVALLERNLLRGVRCVVRQGHAAVRMARVEEHVRDGRPQGLGDPDAHLLRRP